MVRGALLDLEGVLECLEYSSSHPYYLCTIKKDGEDIPRNVS